MKLRMHRMRLLTDMPYPTSTAYPLPAQISVKVLSKPRSKPRGKPTLAQACRDSVKSVGKSRAKPRANGGPRGIFELITST